MAKVKKTIEPIVDEVVESTEVVKEEKQIEKVEEPISDELSFFVTPFGRSNFRELAWPGCWFNQRKNKQIKR